MFKDFIISSAIVLLSKAVKAKPNSKLAKLIQDEKLKKTILDVAQYYAFLEAQLEEEEGEENGKD